MLRQNVCDDDKDKSRDHGAGRFGMTFQVVAIILVVHAVVEAAINQRYLRPPDDAAPCQDDKDKESKGLEGPAGGESDIEAFDETVRPKL